MAISVSGQDESNPALGLGTEQARWSYLDRSGLPAVSRKKNFSKKPNSKPFIDQAYSRKMTGYWPRSFIASLWTKRGHAKKRAWPISSHLDLTLRH